MSQENKEKAGHRFAEKIEEAIAELLVDMEEELGELQHSMDWVLTFDRYSLEGYRGHVTFASQHTSPHAVIGLATQGLDQVKKHGGVTY